METQILTRRLVAEEKTASLERDLKIHVAEQKQKYNEFEIHHQVALHELDVKREEMVYARLEMAEEHEHIRAQTQAESWGLEK